MNLFGCGLPWMLVAVSMLTMAACSGKSDHAPDGGGSTSGGECDPDAGAAGPSLLTNGGFEEPAVPLGGFTLFSNGEVFSGWTVMGAVGNVAPLSTAFASPGFSFPAQAGQQSVDMTGTSDTATGISQTVTTTPGHTYCLSFWVGNVFDPGGGYGTTSTINVLVDGKLVSVATNEDNDTTLSWQQFTSTVHATGASTAIAFVNADPVDDSSNFLDSVALR